MKKEKRTRNKRKKKNEIIMGQRKMLERIGIKNDKNERHL